MLFLFVNFKFNLSDIVLYQFLKDVIDSLF